MSSIDRGAIVRKRMSAKLIKRKPMHFLKRNIVNILFYCKDELQDWMFVIGGNEGVGKSTLAIQVAKVLDPDFDMDIQFINSFDEGEHSYRAFLEKFRYVPFKACVFDEAISSLFSRDYNKGDVKNFVKLFTENRFLHHFPILVMPNPWLLDKELRERRSKTFLYCFRKKKSKTRYVAVYMRKAFSRFLMNEHLRGVFVNSEQFLLMAQPNFVERFSRLSKKKESVYSKIKDENFGADLVKAFGENVGSKPENETVYTFDKPKKSGRKEN